MRPIKLRIRRGSRYRSTMSWQSIDLDAYYIVTDEQIDEQIMRTESLCLTLIWLAIAAITMLVMGALALYQWLLAAVGIAVIAGLFRLCRPLRQHLWNDREGAKKAILQRRQQHLEDVLGGRL
jgi:hypothetical protein